MADYIWAGWASTVGQTRWDLSCVGEKWYTYIWSIIFVNQHTCHQCCVSDGECMLLVFIGLLYSANGRLLQFSIYKKGNYYGPLTDERYPSVESMIAVYSRTEFVTEDNITVKLTNQLIPDKWATTTVIVCVCVCTCMCTYNCIYVFTSHYLQRHSC